MTTISQPIPASRDERARGGPGKFLSDTGIVFLRELQPLIRDPFSVMFGLVQPLIFLALFGPLLGDVPGVPQDDRWQWFVPGILAMAVLYAGSTTGANLLFEMQTGAHERMMVTPLSRSSLMVGRALKEIAPVAVQSILIVLVMLPFGFRFAPLAGLAGLGILAMFGIGLGSLSYALAIAVRKTDWMFWLVQQTLIFPLLILSGMLLPIDAGPGWLEAMSKANPLTYIVEAERALFGGNYGDNSILWGTVAAAATALVGLTVGLRMMRRSML